MRVSEKGLCLTKGKETKCRFYFLSYREELSSVPGGVTGDVSTILSHILSGSKEELVQLSSRSVQVHKAEGHLIHQFDGFGSQVTGNPITVFNKSIYYLSKQEIQRRQFQDRFIQQLCDVPFLRNSHSFFFWL